MRLCLVVRWIGGFIHGALTTVGGVCPVRVVCLDGIYYVHYLVCFADWRRFIRGVRETDVPPDSVLERIVCAAGQVPEGGEIFLVDLTVFVIPKLGECHLYMA